MRPYAKLFPTCLLIVGLLPVASVQAIVVVSESFGGSAADPLNGTTADTFAAAITTAGGSATWSAQSFNADGTTGAASVSALLAMGDYINNGKGDPDGVYTLTATLHDPPVVNSSAWIALSFFNASANPSDHFTEGGSAGQGTVIFRESNQIAAWAGPGTANGLGSAGQAGDQTIQIVLDLSGWDGAANWGTISIYYNAGQLGTTQNLVADADYAYIGLSNSGNVRQASNFSLDKQATLPTVTISTADTTVFHATTTYDISGTTDGTPVGTMSWSNALTTGSATFAAATPWTANAIPLDVGANVITVSGTNAGGHTGTDNVTITRLAEDAVYVDITSPDATVENAVTSYAISGIVNENVVGNLSWSNALTGDSATVSASSPWNINSIPLDVGVNVITVSGDDGGGNTDSDVITITRSSAIVADFNDLTGGGAALGGQAGGTGFSGTWGTGSPINVYDEDLTAPGGLGYGLVQSGNARSVEGDGGGNNCQRTLTTALTNNTIWFSFLVNNGANARAGLRFNNTGGSPDLRLLALGTSLWFQGTSTGGQFTLGQTALVLGKITVDDGGSDTFDIWVDPDVSGGEAGLPAASYSKTGAYITAAGLTSIGAISYGSDDGKVDMIYFSDGPTGFDDVTSGQGFHVTISTPDATFKGAASIDIVGNASASVAGTMSWSNALTGGSATFAAATPWAVSVPLAVGTNVITISGSNGAGDTDNDTVTITYEPEGTTIRFK